MSGSDNIALGPFRVRAFFHWRKPGMKERHGFSMGVFSAEEKTPESVACAVKAAHAKLAEFDIIIDKLEWR